METTNGHSQNSQVKEVVFLAEYVTVKYKDLMYVHAVIVIP